MRRVRVVIDEIHLSVRRCRDFPIGRQGSSSVRSSILVVVVVGRVFFDGGGVVGLSLLWIDDAFGGRRPMSIQVAVDFVDGRVGGRWIDGLDVASVAPSFAFG